MGNGWQQERQQSEEMHQLLRKRIEFLTEELEMTRSELNVKAQECDELMEVAEELDKELARDRPSDESDSEEVHDQTKAQTWLEKLQENLQLSASKHSKGARLSSLRWIDTLLQVRARVRVGLSLARSHPLFRARVCARVRSPSPCCPPASVL
jgi:tetrahydrodipicolinate N-succinyltransferase